MRKIKGITLISLVITIVVLIILSSVAIYLSLGNNGIFTRAKEAKEATNKQAATEIINLKITSCQMNKYAEKQEMPTLKELSLTLKDDNEIEYVTQTSKVASTEYDVPSENPSSIFTKLNKYPYEFEINSSLQLASINGIKVATENTISNKEGIDYKTDGTEQKTSDTLDGKPIYLKYVEMQIATIGWNSMAHNIKNVDKIWIDKGNSYIIDNGYFYDLPDGGSTGCSYRASKTDIGTYNDNSLTTTWIDKIAMLLIKYTKTTD